MDDVFTDSVERLFQQNIRSDEIRQIEAGAGLEPLWSRFEESGFLDALIPEAHDGAGLTLAQAFPLFLLAGRYAVPAPFVQTMLARAYFAQAGYTAPAGPVALLGELPAANGNQPACAMVSFGRTAQWVLTAHDQKIVLLPLHDALRTASIGHASLDAVVQWPKDMIDQAMQSPVSAAADLDMDSLIAAGHAALIAGAADRVLDMTLDYAGQRTQFGKPVGKFQAVQNQISVLAERAWVARMAAQLACQSSDWRPSSLMAAVGKARASEAAAVVADISHAVHGAIGITEEYDLQLYTRRLREWRHAGGAESFWEARVGRALLSRPNDTALSFMCRELTP